MEDDPSNPVDQRGETEPPKSEGAARRKINWNTAGILLIQAATLVVLALTLIYVSKQANYVADQTKELQKSTALTRYTTEIQNQPYIHLGNSIYHYNPDTKFVTIFSRATCFGNTPAHNFRTKKAVLFYIVPSKFMIQSFVSHEDRGQADLRLGFYLKGIRDEALKYIQENPSFSVEKFKEYLSAFSNKPTKVSNEALKWKEISLDIDDFHFYDEAPEYNIPEIVFPPTYTALLSFSRAVGGDLIPSIKNYEKILFFYQSKEYEGMAPGKILETHWFGYLDGKDINEVRVKIDQKELTVFELKDYKTWMTRTQMP